MTETLTKSIDQAGTKALTLNRTVLSVILSAVSGIFFYLAFPPVNLWPLIFLAAVPYAELRELTAENYIYIYFTYAYHEEDAWHNETVLISPDGTFSPIYGKQHAFGEPPTVTAGTSPVNQTPYGDLGSIICMDGVFTDASRESASNGAQIMAIPTYNTTVGISEQNWTHFIFRSVENQVPVVNADRGYYTMITDSHGNIQSDTRIPQGASEVVLADVTLASSVPPLYTQVGDILGYVSLAGFVFFIFCQSRVEKRAKQAGKAK